MKSTILLNSKENRPIATDIIYNENAGRCPVILYAHGFNGFKDWGNFDLIADQFKEAGFTFIKFNFSYNGTSPDHPEDFVDLDGFAENNYTRELDDLLVVLDWIEDQDNPYAPFLQSHKLGLVGHSMGGGIGIIKTAEDPRIKALVTWASISACKTPWGNWTEEKMEEWKSTGVAYYYNGRTKQQMPMKYQLFQNYEHNKERLDILKAAHNIQVPFLICHGTEDTSVSSQSATDIQAATGKKAQLLLVQSDHVFGRKHPWNETSLPQHAQEVVTANIRFFKEHLYPS